ncbi:MAG: ribbon-helix-helix domain-containing protein [Rhabdaerophilum sp.]
MSGIIKRSLSIAGHRTSISLEEPFWRLLQAEAQTEGLSIPALVERIDRARSGTNLSSAIRVHLLSNLMESSGVRLTVAQE